MTSLQTERLPKASPVKSWETPNTLLTDCSDVLDYALVRIYQLGHHSNAQVRLDLGLKGVICAKALNQSTVRCTQTIQDRQVQDEDTCIINTTAECFTVTPEGQLKAQRNGIVAQGQSTWTVISTIRLKAELLWHQGDGVYVFPGLLTPSVNICPSSVHTP